jgi:hypothetical protein
MLFRASEKGFTIGEVPIIFYERQLRRFKMSLAIAFEALFLAVWLKMSSVLNIKRIF